MKITTIKQRDFHRRALKFLRRIQPGESTTQNQNAMPRRHARPSFRSNPAPRSIISLVVTGADSMSRKRKLILSFRGLALLLLSLFPVLYAGADGPALASDASSRTSATSEPASVHSPSSPVVVLGFLGGFVRHDDAVHSTVQVARSLQKDYS